MHCRRLVMQHPSSRPMVLRDSFQFLILVTKKRSQNFRPFTVKDKGSKYFGNFWRFCSDFDTLLVQNDNRFKAGYEHNGELYMLCYKKVKNNVIYQLQFFSDVNIEKFRLYFSINSHFIIFFSYLNCSLNGLR